MPRYRHVLIYRPLAISAHGLLTYRHRDSGFGLQQMAVGRSLRMLAGAACTGGRDGTGLAGVRGTDDQLRRASGAGGFGWRERGF